jgi:hypothetical protein
MSIILLVSILLTSSIIFFREIFNKIREWKEELTEVEKIDIMIKYEYLGGEHEDTRK